MLLLSYIKENKWLACNFPFSCQIPYNVCCMVLGCGVFFLLVVLFWGFGGFLLVPWVLLFVLLITLFNPRCA